VPTCTRHVACQEPAALPSQYCAHHRDQQVIYAANQKAKAKARAAKEKADREMAAKKKKEKQAAAKKKEKQAAAKAEVVPKKVVSRTEQAQTVPSTPSPLPVVPPVFTETPSPTQGRGDATVAGHLRSSHEDQMTALEERLTAQWETDIGDLRADNLLHKQLLSTRVDMASRLDERLDQMRDRLDALTARLWVQETRHERMRYRSRSRSRTPDYMERERPRYRR